MRVLIPSCWPVPSGLPEKGLPPGTTARSTTLPRWSVCGSGLDAGVYPWGAPESDIGSSFILYFPRACCLSSHLLGKRNVSI